ncbi:uncharacterized protein si:cabz01085394.1 isoform X1 [Danio rerio]|uniref:Uncharacterized protein si:cabz01085394.1 isoform X1 n=1 Tax=Danio rerio TaxID=7955 RepID=A0AC58G2F5_DANRE
MGRNAAFLLLWGILNSCLPPDYCQINLQTPESSISIPSAPVTLPGIQTPEPTTEASTSKSDRNSEKYSETPITDQSGNTSEYTATNKDSISPSNTSRVLSDTDRNTSTPNLTQNNVNTTNDTTVTADSTYLTAPAEPSMSSGTTESAEDQNTNTATTSPQPSDNTSKYTPDAISPQFSSSTPDSSLEKTSESNISISSTPGTLTRVQTHALTADVSTNRNSEKHSESSLTVPDPSGSTSKYTAHTTTERPSYTSEDSLNPFSTLMTENHSSITASIASAEKTEHVSHNHNKTASTLNTAAELISASSYTGISNEMSDIEAPESTAADIFTVINTDDSSLVSFNTNKSPSSTTTDAVDTSLFTASDFETFSTDIQEQYSTPSEPTDQEDSLTPSPQVMSTLVTNHLLTQSNQAVTSNSTNQGKQISNADTISNAFSPVASTHEDLISSPNPVTDPSAHEPSQKNDSDSTDSCLNSTPSIPADLTNSPLSTDTIREGIADKCERESIIFLLNTRKVPVFKTLAFNYPLMHQVTIMSTLSKP